MTTERDARALERRPGDGTVALRFKPPYDWPAMLAFLRLRSIPGVEHVGEESYSRTFEIGGAHGIVHVSRDANDSLRAEVRTPNPAALPIVVARLRKLFDLDADPEVVGNQLAQDSVLAPLVAQRPGLRVPGAWDGFELAIRAVLGQQITVTAAIRLAGKIVERYGDVLGLEGRAHEPLTRVFPRPEQLAQVDLAPLGMPRTRAKSLASMAAAVVADAKIFVPRGDLQADVARLCELPGVGEWTAQYIAMRELREPDAFPAADIGLMRAMADANGRRPTARELLARAERWRPWRAYAAQHLWASYAPHSAVDK